MCGASDGMSGTDRGYPGTCLSPHVIFIWSPCTPSQHSSLRCSQTSHMIFSIPQGIFPEAEGKAVRLLKTHLPRKSCNVTSIIYYGPKCKSQGQPAQGLNIKSHESLESHLWRQATMVPNDNKGCKGEGAIVQRTVREDTSLGRQSLSWALEEMWVPSKEREGSQ